MTTHFTFLPIDLVDDPSDADAVHKQTMALFAGADLPGDEGMKRAGANILWRWERDGVIVSSDIEATDVPDGAQTWARDAELSFPAGSHIRFVATVDAVTRVRGKVRPVGDVTAWFADKVRAAFEVTSYQFVASSFARRRDARLEQVTVAGIGVVTDPAELARLTREGIGRSKAFGCGMLQAAAA